MWSRSAIWVTRNVFEEGHGSLGAANPGDRARRNEHAAPCSHTDAIARDDGLDRVGHRTGVRDGSPRLRDLPGTRCQLVHVREHVVRMSRDVRHAVRLADDAPGIDQIRAAFGPFGELFLGRSLRFVDPADGVVDVAQQREREALQLLEALVLFRCVERDADDLGACLLELGGSVTEPLALRRSTGGVRLGEPPQDHPPAPKVRERNRVAVLVRQREIGGGRSFLQHRSFPSLECPRSVRGGHAFTRGRPSTPGGWLSPSPPARPPASRPRSRSRRSS
jgi:hypothetical protein